MRKRHFNRYLELKNEYEESWMSKHKDISDFIYNNGGRFEDDEHDQNRGERRDEEILDNTPTTAHRSLVSGLYSGITSPASDWFRLTIDNPQLKEVQTIRAYFEECTRIIKSDLFKSNFYTSAESVYGELSAFGTACMQVDEDFDTIFRFTPYTMGEYYVDTDHRNRVDSVYRVFQMRAKNVVRKFGIDNVSTNVKNAVIAPKSGNEWVKILHVQEPNVDRDITMMDARNKPFISVYYEKDRNENQPPLRVSGYDSQPFVGPRWSVAGSATWGVGPGELALGDVKQLMEVVEDMLVAIKKSISPPVVVSAQAGDVQVNTGARQVTWVNEVTKGQQPVISPAYQVDTDIEKVLLLIQMLHQRIRSTFFVDLFFALSAQDNRQKTATEIIAMQQELLRLLGPVIERLIPEMLRPILQRCFEIEQRMGRLPEAPEEIQGMDIKVEIISLIAQAQALTIITPIEQFLTMASSMAQTWPEVLDKVDADQALDLAGIALGIDSSMINSDEVVQSIREFKAQQIANQQLQDQATQSISNAQQLSQTDTAGNNALTAILGGAAA
jgi:hypothetical protein